MVFSAWTLFSLLDSSTVIKSVWYLSHAKNINVPWLFQPFVIHQWSLSQTAKKILWRTYFSKRIIALACCHWGCQGSSHTPMHSSHPILANLTSSHLTFSHIASLPTHLLSHPPVSHPTHLSPYMPLAAPACKYYTTKHHLNNACNLDSKQ